MYFGVVTLFFGVVKLPFVFLSVMLSLVILVYYVFSWWSGTVGWVSVSLPVLSPAGRGWCLVGDRLCISLLVYFGVV